MKFRTLTVILAGSLLSVSAMAQDVPGHPRINEVDGRVNEQQQRIDKGVADGQISAGQAAHDTQRDEKVEQRLSKDEAKHNGHITKGEKRRLNKSLNHNSRHIKHQRAATPPAAAPAR